MVGGALTECSAGRIRGDVSSERRQNEDEKPSPVPSSLPERIGRFRVVGKLGEGGMGIVLEAEQESPRRRVALKIGRAGAELDDLQVRMFQREADTLARLEHPNIAAIYEAGRTDDGRQFFAMELVRGRTLKQWLESRPIHPDDREIARRLELFRTRPMHKFGRGQKNGKSSTQFPMSWRSIFE